MIKRKKRIKRMFLDTLNDLIMGTFFALNSETFIGGDFEIKDQCVSFRWYLVVVEKLPSDVSFFGAT